MGRKSRRLKFNSTIGIFCEGESEKQYFTMLKQKYRTANVQIKILAADLSGKSLVNKAIQTSRYNKWQVCYVVFDRDEHSKDELKACSVLAKKYNIKIIFSSIDFEIWILMHFERVARAYTRKELVTKLSGKKYFDQDYSRFKGNSYRQYLFDSVQTAIDNAKWLYKDHHDWINDDPFTNIHIYLRKIFRTESF